MGCTFNIFIPFSLALDQHDPTTLSNLQRLNKAVVAEMNSDRDELRQGEQAKMGAPKSRTKASRDHTRPLASLQ
jgi:hypothetical protein